MKVEFFNTEQEKRDSFLNELKSLLNKYQAEIVIKDFGRAYTCDDKIVINFKYDEHIFENAGSGIVGDIVLGQYFGCD